MRTVGSRGARLELDLASAPPLGEGASSGLYQVARETLDQVVRRGPPTTVKVTLRPTRMVAPSSRSPTTGPRSVARR